MMHANTAINAEPSFAFASPFYRELMPFCLSGLRRTLNPQTRLFDRQLRDGRLDRTRGTEDFTSTCICLIGIDRAEVGAEFPALDVDETLAAAARLARSPGYLRSVGLLVWANAVAGREDFAALAARIGLKCDEIFMETLTTMELAWLASGLLHDVKRSQSAGLRKIAAASVQMLRARFNPETLLMRHTGAGAGLRDRVRRNIPNFADQIYPVQALSFAAMVLDDEDALTIATRLAGRLVELQGPLGQWWWHYDAERGGVAEPFPVYSVHQHAMAPMALSALAAASGPDYTLAIKAGQAWITRNELGQSLVSPLAETIWRDIERREPSASGLARKARHLMAGPPRAMPDRPPEKLRINLETRPYEWAWCLYAGAIEENLPSRNHIA